MQTGFKFALEHGYELAVRLDGDGQHDPAELPKLLARCSIATTADIVVGSRFVGGAGDHRGLALTRRIGIVFFARLVSLLTRQRVTDTTQAFRR